MAAFFNSGAGRPRSLSNESDRPPKKLTTAAGMRLSVIMENTIDQKTSTRRTSRSTFSKGSTLVDNPRESDEHRAKYAATGGYAYNDMFSEKQNAILAKPSLKNRIANSSFLSRKGGWKRVLIFLLILIICIIAIVVGVVVGLQQSNKDDDSNSAQSDSQSSGGSEGSGAVPAGSPGNGVGSSPASTDVPDGFPAGTYSFTTFLDTVNADCTTTPATWACFPYTIYNNSPTKALTTFNWIIREKSKDSYQVSSVNNPFAINFENAAMKIVDKGGDNERYQFQVTMDKTIIPSPSITDDGSTSTCFYNATTFSAYLYTKRAKDYPSEDLAVSNGTYQSWPFAVRVEQTAAGGEDAPNCYQTTNGNLGERIDVAAGNATSLCSCLYRNFLTKSPYS